MWATGERLSFWTPRRPPDAILTPDSMGLFSVGMKRAFFKFGKMFSVESSFQREAFTMDVDVDKWLSLSRRPWSAPCWKILRTTLISWTQGSGTPTGMRNIG
jgi:hypothetical protein